MENSMEFPLKIKNRTMIFSSNSTPSYLNEDKKSKKKRKEKRNLKKNMHPCTNYIISYNSPDTAETLVHINT